MAAAGYAGAEIVVYERPAPVVVEQRSAPVVIERQIVTSPASEVYQARVISSQAVTNGPQQHCWMEKRNIGPLELPGAIVGGFVDLFAGRQSTDYVQRCTTVNEGTAYWDVTYEFRGVQHHAQLGTSPGTTIAVNGYGEPLA